ncbi:MAG: signal peptidase II [Planctomycetota bacterium]|nr:signal peptidase II [Planctomycetota bacterium]
MVTSPRAWTVLLTVVVLGLVSDLASKYAAFHWIPETPVSFTREQALAVGPQNLEYLLPDPPPVVVVAPSVLELKLVLNPGAVFGLGAGKRWFFVVMTGAAFAFALWMFTRWTTRRDTAAHIGIGLLLSGGLGNLYDRLVYACVRDFLHPLPGVRLPFGWSWPWGGRDVWPYVSNIADLWLIIGVGILIVYSWRQPQAALAPERAQAPKPANKQAPKP